MSNGASPQQLQLQQKLSIYKGFQVMKFVFAAWKRLHGRRQKRLVRLDRMVDFFERSSENLTDRVFNAWRNHIRLRRIVIQQKQYQIQRRVNAWESVLKICIIRGIRYSFHSMETYHISAKIVTYFAERIVLKRTPIIVSELSDTLFNLHNGLVERNTFYQRYYNLKLQKRFFEEWTQLHHITGVAKKLRYYAFEGRRQTLQIKSFLALRQNQVRGRNLRLRYNFLKEHQERKLKSYHLLSWIRVCVQNYQASTHRKNSVMQRSFQILKLWTAWSRANRNQTEEAQSYYKYGQLRKIIANWKGVTNARREKYALIDQFRGLQVARFYITLIQEWARIANTNNQQRVNQLAADEQFQQTCYRKVFKAWTEQIDVKQAKYLNNFTSKNACKALMNNRYFSAWKAFTQHKQNMLVKDQELMQSINQTLKQKAIMQFKQIITQISAKSQRIQVKLEKSIVARVFNKLILRFRSKRNQIRLIKSLQEDKQLKLVSQIYYYWRVHSKKHRHKRYLHKKSQKHYALVTNRKSLEKLMMHTWISCREKQLVANVKQKLLRQTFSFYRSEFLYSRALRGLIMKQRERQQRMVIKVLSRYNDKRKYEKFSIRYQQIRRTKALLRYTFQQMQLFHVYQQRKQLVKVNMLKLHYVKFIKRFFNAFKRLRRRKLELQTKAADLRYLHEFRLKRTFFKNVMLHIIDN